MSVIDETWLRRAFNAMQSMLDVDVRTRNAMIQFLIDEGFWSAEKLSNFDSAIAKWNACKNPQKSEFFKVSELWALALRFERHDLFAAIVEDLGYEPLRRRPTEERRQDLLQRIADVTERQQQEIAQLHAALARLAPAVPAAEPVIPGSRPSFSLGSASCIPDTAVGRIGCP